MFHGLRTNKSCPNKFMAIKTDMSKAYDRVEWRFITAQRGLRQGDPLSPYLFIMCTEALTGNIKKAARGKQLTGLKVARACPAVSHLLFADDSLFF